MKKILKNVNKYQIYIVFTLLCIISFYSFLYFFSNNEHLLYGDSLSRLNISRKIVDNLTPGLTQLGNVWLPLPEILMLFFTWNKILWHTGIAGSIVSMGSFIIGGLYLYKTAKIISNFSIAALLSLSIYALNINLLYLQTTAMSEPIFLCSIVMAIYYFILWIKSGNKIHYLIFAGIAVSSATLIRYEALAILGASVPMVFFYSFHKTKNYHRSEASILMYSLVAFLGFFIWTIYLLAIFKDPFFWNHYYLGTKTATDVASSLKILPQHLSYIEAFLKYLATMIWMNGLIPVLIAIISLPFLIYDFYKSKSYYFLPVLISLSMFVLMILTLHKNTPINQPDLTIGNILSPTTSNFNEFNIRYGIIMLPMISLLSVYLFKLKYKLVKILILCILLIQINSYFIPKYTVIFQLPVSLVKNIDNTAYKADQSLVEWINANYDGGLIMISALGHDPQMFQLGYDYKTYIHEGTGKYWTESIKRPQEYATWIVFDNKKKDDQVTKFLNDSKSWRQYYNLVYNEDGVHVYKIKTKPFKNI